MSSFTPLSNFRVCLSPAYLVPIRDSRHFQEGKQKSDGLEEDLDDLDLEDDTADNKPLVTTFELNETLYAEAELEDTDVVYLWLGVRSPHLRSFCIHN